MRIPGATKYSNKTLLLVKVFFNLKGLQIRNIVAHGTGHLHKYFYVIVTLLSILLTDKSTIDILLTQIFF